MGLQVSSDKIAFSIGPPRATIGSQYTLGKWRISTHSRTNWSSGLKPTFLGTSFCLMTIIYSSFHLQLYCLHRCTLSNWKKSIVLYAVENKTYILTYWPDFDQTSKVGSFFWTQQFFRPKHFWTTILTTRTTIKTISTQILNGTKKNFTQIFFWWWFFWTQHIFDLTFLTNNSFGSTFSFNQKIFGSKIFGTKNPTDKILLNLNIDATTNQ